MRSLAKAFGYFGGQRVVTVLLSAVRVKIAAVVLGPAGIGIVAQVTSFKALADRFVNLGVGGGLSKYVAEYHATRDRESLQTLFDTAAALFTGAGVIAVLTLTLLSPWLAELILADRSLAMLVVIGAFALPLTAQIQIINRFLQGLLRVRQLVLLNIVTSVAGVGIAAPLMIYGGVTGAVAAIPLSILPPLVIGYWYLLRTLRLEHGIRLRVRWPDGRFTRDLLKFGAARGIVMASDLGSMLVIRSLIIRQLGAAANGMYQVAWAASNQYLAVITSSIWMYAMPKIASILGDDEAVERTQNDSLRLTLLVMVPLLVVLLATRGLWIPLLYGVEFLAAYHLVGLQMIGDLFRSVTWSVNLTNYPRERFNIEIGTGVVYAASRLAIFLFLFGRMGLMATAVAYLAGNIIQVVMAVEWHRRAEGFLFEGRVWSMLGVGFVLVLGTAWATWDPGASAALRYGVSVMCLGAWGGFALRGEDGREVMNLFRRRRGA